MTTWDDLVGRQPPAVWRSIRRRRANPSFPTDLQRLDTFRGALEQAQQQFEAAANIGYASRPLNLFYGLSQAGRAVAAAGQSLSGATDWKLSGHGITAENMDKARSVGDVTLSSYKTGSFVQVSKMLGSARPPIKVEKGHQPSEPAWTVEELWPYLYESRSDAALSATTLYQPINAYWSCIEGRPMCEASLSLPPDVQEIPITSRPKLSDFLEHYPSLKGWDRTATTDWPAPNVLLTLYWQTTVGSTQNDMVKLHSTLYRGQRLIFPALRNKYVLHPLMAWWSVLYALSMLARYQPAAWTRMIDVDRSEQATAIERILDVAVAAVPDLIDETIQSL